MKLEGNEDLPVVEMKWANVGNPIESHPQNHNTWVA